MFSIILAMLQFSILKTYIIGPKTVSSYQLHIIGPIISRFTANLVPQKSRLSVLGTYVCTSLPLYITVYY